MQGIKTLIERHQRNKYYKKREERWNEFKKTYTELECGLLKNSRWTWEKECHNCSYKKDFFEKYGCMYIKDFMDY